jgi:hypothetical protein
MVLQVKIDIDHCPKEEIHINGMRTEGIKDSGADMNIISSRLYKAKKLPRYLLEKEILVGTFKKGDSHKIQYGTKAIVTQGNKSKLTTFAISELPEGTEVILGRPWIKENCPEAIQALESYGRTPELPPSKNPKEAFSAGGVICAIEAEEQRRKCLLIQHTLQKQQSHHLECFRTQVQKEIEERKTPSDSTSTEKPPVRGMKMNPEGWEKMIPTKFHEYLDVFADPKPDTKPVYIPGFNCDIILKDGEIMKSCKLYNMSTEELQVLKQLLDRQLAYGIIRPSSAEAGSPVFFVKDPASEGRNESQRQLRLVVDYRQLNSKIRLDDYPLPLTRREIQRLSKAKFLGTADARSGYDLTPMEPGKEHLTAFRTQFGQFEYTRMPQGLATAPAIFQRRLNHILQHLLGHCVYVYLDDIVIFADTQEEYDEAWKQLLKALRKGGIFLSPKKCTFNEKEVRLLGYVIVVGEGVRMAHDKCTTLHDIPPPTRVTDVRRFLGMANFYSSFIPHFADKTACLTELTKKDKQWEWTEQCQRAFEIIKQNIREDVFLVGFDPELPITMETDASDVAHGGVIKQPRSKTDQRLAPLYFFHHKFKEGEKGWDGPDKELYAIVHAFKEFRDILASPQHCITVISDHRNLAKFMFSSNLQKGHDGRLGRWWTELSEYWFQIEYRPGSENVEADFLSRYGYEDSAALDSHILLPLHRFTTKAMTDIANWFKQSPHAKNIREKLEQTFAAIKEKVPPVLADVGRKLNDSPDPVPEPRDPTKVSVHMAPKQRLLFGNRYSALKPGAQLIETPPQHIRVGKDKRGLGYEG